MYGKMNEGKTIQDKVKLVDRLYQYLADNGFTNHVSVFQCMDYIDTCCDNKEWSWFGVDVPFDRMGYNYRKIETSKNLVDAIIGYYGQECSHIMVKVALFLLDFDIKPILGLTDDMVKEDYKLTEEDLFDDSLWCMWRIRI